MAERGGAVWGQEVPFSNKPFCISATYETFGLLSCCKCDSSLSKDGFRCSFLKLNRKS